MVAVVIGGGPRLSLVLAPFRAAAALVALGKDTVLGAYDAWTQGTHGGTWAGDEVRKGNVRHSLTIDHVRPWDTRCPWCAVRVESVSSDSVDATTTLAPETRTVPPAAFVLDPCGHIVHHLRRINLKGSG